MDIPFQVPREVYFKDITSFKIDVIELTKNNLHFNAERVYILSTEDSDNMSGNHAHLNQSQILFLLKGKAELLLKSIDKKSYFFDLEGEGVFVPSKYWIELKLSAHSVVLCIASRSYDTLQSINDFNEFLRLR